MIMSSRGYGRTILPGGGLFLLAFMFGYGCSREDFGLLPACQLGCVQSKAFMQLDTGIVLTTSMVEEFAVEQGKKDALGPIANGTLAPPGRMINFGRLAVLKSQLQDKATCSGMPKPKPETPPMWMAIKTTGIALDMMAELTICQGTPPEPTPPPGRP